MRLTEINLVVAELEVSHRFYLGLGWVMRPITAPDQPEVQAWLTTSGPAPVTLHSQPFASWWDASGVRVQPGSTTIDLTFDLPAELDQFIERTVDLGGALIAARRPMPWGQSYAIVGDPDGYRWGLKAPILES